MSEYATIVADPPWETTAGAPWAGRGANRGGSGASRPLPYPTMQVGEIAALQVPAADNAHLYLWTINSRITDAFYIADLWGFKFSTMLVWAKNPMGSGLGGAHGLATEYCLFARKGKLPALGRAGRNWWNWKRPYGPEGKPRHSAKPPEFFEMVESVSPGPYLEMFARNHRPGWDSWGNEVSSAVEISAHDIESNAHEPIIAGAASPVLKEGTK